MTVFMVGSCSNQLSVSNFSLALGISKMSSAAKGEGCLNFGRERKEEKWSDRLDLNQRPPPPQGGALPGCATVRQLVQM